MSPQASNHLPGISDFGRAASRVWWYLSIGATLALAIVLFTMAATGWREFRIPDDGGYDLAFFNQGYYLALHGHGWLHSTVLEPPVYHGAVLAGHFSPSLYLLLPFYAVWQSPLLLLLVASFAVAAGGAGVLLAARRIFGSPAIAMLWFGLFGLHPSIAWSLQTNGFREVFLAMGFLSFALLAYLRRNDRLLFLMLGLAILCKEDIALLLPVWGVVAWLQGRGRRLAGAMAVLGVAYFLFANLVALPLIRGYPLGHVFFQAFPQGMTSATGSTPGGVIRWIRSPGELTHLALSRQNLGYWSGVLGTLLFLPLLGWEYAMIPAYVYVEITLAPMLQNIALRHVFPALPFIFVAAMVGASRIAGFIARLSPLPSPRSATARNVGLAALLCGVTASTVHSTPLPDLVRIYYSWSTEAVLRRDAGLYRALARTPREASLASTTSLIAESSSRDVLYFLRSDGANAPEMVARGPDYIAINLADLEESSRSRGWIASVVCGGTYGIVYADRVGSRMLLERGADVSVNRLVYDAGIFMRMMWALQATGTVTPVVRRACPEPLPATVRPEVFRRAAALHVRERFPSVIRSNEAFPGPVVTLSDGRFSQAIHLPDHRFEPGWYRMEVGAVWPWLWAPGASRMTARMLVGERAVGEATARNDQSLEYTTPPFHIDRRATLPLRVQMELDTPGGQTGTVWVLRPARRACAVVANAPSLNPRQLTVEAWVYAEGLNRHRGAESEAPLLSKGDALGYYLRLSGDDQGRVWVDLNVAGKWAAGRAGFVPLRKWTHVAATYDGHEARIYLDGVPAARDPWRSPRYEGRIRSEGAPLLIGCRDLGQPNEIAFAGRITGVRVWNRVLSVQELNDEAGIRRLPDRSPGLVGSWEFQELAGGRILDRSPAGNAITNGARLARAPAGDMAQPLAAWRSRQVNVLRFVTVRRATP